MFATAVSNHHVGYSTDYCKANDGDNNCDGDLGTFAEGWRTTVNRVARMATGFVVRASLEGGIEWVGSVVRDVHRGEGEERGIVIDSDLRSGVSQLVDGEHCRKKLYFCLRPVIANIPVLILLGWTSHHGAVENVGLHRG